MGGTKPFAIEKKDSADISGIDGGSNATLVAIGLGLAAHYCNGYAHGSGTFRNGDVILVMLFWLKGVKVELIIVRVIG